MNIKYIISLILLIAFCGSLNAAEIQYAGAKKVKIYSEPKFSSKVITVLEKGNPLEVLEKKGKWAFVQKSGINGWVPRYALTKTQVKRQPVSFFNRIKRFFYSENKRSRASTISTAGGIRGLSDSENPDGLVKDYNSLKKMEDVQISEKDLQKFIEENKR